MHENGTQTVKQVFDLCMGHKLFFSITAKWIQIVKLDISHGILAGLDY